MLIWDRVGLSWMSYMLKSGSPLREMTSLLVIRLWHQLTEALRVFVLHPSFQNGGLVEVIVSIYFVVFDFNYFVSFIIISLLILSTSKLLTYI